ncbi:hypothetical protein H5U35_01435 [Candidatus Aerophobetes bacterium]|nr:hypothetical protein [Candidatus Aerophobetes bacterium]
MFHLILIVAFLVILYLYLMRRDKGKVRVGSLRDEVELRCDFYHQQVLNFLKKLKKTRSRTRLARLDSEIERFQKVMELDDLLEKAEREKVPQKAIDWYLEALSYIMKHDFERERKAEIEDRIKSLQEKKGREVFR